MKEYYSERFRWIFNYTSKNFFYCLLKTLCIIVGLPLYVISVAIEMVFTFVNMIFCWIPIFGMVIGLICKAIIFVFDKTFFICILTDLKRWIIAHPKEAVSEQATENQSDTATEAVIDDVDVLKDTDDVNS